jgi:integral membrane protein
MENWSIIRSLRIVAIMEGVSYLLLGITMPLKYLMEIPQPNYLVGMAHGLLFMMYIGLVLLTGQKYHWNLKTYFWSLLASIIPAGTFVADSKIFRHYDHKAKGQLNN